jgi:hypothetical protein
MMVRGTMGGQDGVPTPIRQEASHEGEQGQPRARPPLISDGRIIERCYRVYLSASCSVRSPSQPDIQGR